MKLLTVIGARPQFVKAAALSSFLASQKDSQVVEEIVHTGQHFDSDMSSIFFRELGIPAPKYNLNISGGSHGEMTGRMLPAIEQVINASEPDVVLVYGDTNSTLAGALSAAKSLIPVVHVESGMRSHNMAMPEEQNRIVVDHISALNFAASDDAMANLQKEGLRERSEFVGDIMFDAVKIYSESSSLPAEKLKSLNFSLETDPFVLATVHRAENTDSERNLAGILSALSRIAKETNVIFPLHPRTLAAVKGFGLDHLLNGVNVVSPLSFREILAVEKRAAVICTDSGGVQKEAFYMSVPCVTVRNETEWIETVELGWNSLVGHDESAIVAAVLGAKKPQGEKSSPYGNGNTAELIVGHLESRTLENFY